MPFAPRSVLVRNIGLFASMNGLIAIALGPWAWKKDISTSCIVALGRFQSDPLSPRKLPNKTKTIRLLWEKTCLQVIWDWLPWVKSCRS